MSCRPLAVVAMLGLAACSHGSHPVSVAADGSPTTVEESTTTTVTEATVPPTTATTSPPTTASPTTVRQRSATTTTAAAAESVQAGQVAVTLVNNMPVTLDITVNGVTRRVAAGSRVDPVGITPNANENDSVSAKTTDGQCGVGDGGPALQYSSKVEIDFNPDPSGQRCPNGAPVPVFVVRR